jgi:pimeloyl-ACP methyl ester carboxylesterase
MRLIALISVALATLGLARGAGATARWDSCTPKQGDLTFRAADGTKLAGHRFGNGKVAVVLAHQSDGDLCGWVPYAKRLAQLGYLALAFDFRNAGASQARGYPANIRYGGDAIAAVKEARALGATKVFVVGASLGGSAALQAATNARPQVDGVISVSGAADLSNAIASVPHLRAPVLYLAGTGDVDFANDARRLYRATSEHRKKLVLLDDSRHGTALVGGNARARSLIEAFLKSH